MSYTDPDTNTLGGFGYGIPGFASAIPPSTSPPPESNDPNWPSLVSQINNNFTASMAIADSILGARAGAGWVSPDGSHMTINVKGLTSADTQALGAQLPSPAGSWSVQNVAWSINDLIGFQSQLETLVSSRVDGASFWQTTIDEKNNLIVANVDSADSDLANALLSAVPQGVLTIAHNDTALDLEQSRFNGAPPYEAGKRVDAGGCTSGLVWTQGTSILGSTAGHCAYNGEAINLSGVFYGFGYNSQYSKPGLIDSDIIFIRGYNPKHYTPPYIYVTDDGFNRIVRAGSRDADLYDGTVVCMSGSATGTPTCGHVYNNFVNGPDGKPDGRRYQGLVCATYSSVTGDSGAPIYEPGKGNRARGLGGHVASARDFKTNARFGGCYSAEGNIEGDAGVHLEIQSGG